ncbi:hypothetical protein [Empedobacter stercoris]|uniref:hypothetical protein n=1 Tax=Empedobacter stercoris TaxID=1628248 RepID=UPI0039EBEF8D
MLDKIKKTPEITPQTVKKFDGKFEGEIDNICEKCRFDIELNDGTKFEYKSYNEASINRISTSDAFLKQHLSYLQDAEGINKIKYEFDAKKFANRDKIVEQFRKMYEKNAQEVFSTMSPQLREVLLGKGNANRFDLFEQSIGNSNSRLYEFINLK